MTLKRYTYANFASFKMPLVCGVKKNTFRKLALNEPYIYKSFTFVNGQVIDIKATHKSN